MLDQVVLVGDQDLGSLPLHIRATAAHNSMVSRTFYIHPDTPAVRDRLNQLQDEFAGCLDAVVFIPEATLLPPAVCSNKWIYQQLLKLSVDALRKTHSLSERFLFTDVDTLCLRPPARSLLYHDDRSIFYLTSEHTESILSDSFVTPANPAVTYPPGFLDWHYAMSWTGWQLLGLETPPVIGAIDACTLWSQKTLRSLKRHITQRTGMPWVQAIIRQYVQFILEHRDRFHRTPGFRPISFSHSAPPGDLSFDELYHSLRLGFSEWQLYAYYVSCIDANGHLLGMLGPQKSPLVAEYNHHNAPQGLIEEIIARTRNGADGFPCFIYFYPNICEKDARLLDAYLQEGPRPS